MDGNGEIIPSPAPADAKKRPGRPRQSTPETHRQKVERLQAELKDAQAAMKLTEEKRATIIGHGALRHARRNTEFARQLAAMLRAEIRAKADRSMIADLLTADPASPAR